MRLTVWYRKLGYSSHNQHYDFFAGKIRRVIGSEIKFLQVTKTCSLGYAHGWLFRICWVKFVEYSYSCLLSIPYFTPSRLKKKQLNPVRFHDLQELYIVCRNTSYLYALQYLSRHWCHLDVFWYWGSLLLRISCYPLKPLFRQ